MLNLFRKKREVVIMPPFVGERIDITEVNDEAFSNKMVGDGVAVIPTSNVAKAPCNGKIIQIFPTNHAFCLETKEGLEILVHIGLDTVELKGKGFKRLVEVGCEVEKGQAIIEADFKYIKEIGKDITSILVITNMDKVDSISKNFNDDEDEMLKVKIKA
ncbi:PTS sugar transporter subunit IIA [Abyssisolibacter fermentans]|uniref:PTS sugar transporter subunit IIA n=1 Tax=Abyssisolibacter fermentans TaxID=1766203 RepID=UPI00082CC044|nr:PTS glucose transporter subunit IIA [Abyssisolibacter fermentans]